MTQRKRPAPAPEEGRAPRPVEICAALATGGLLTFMLFSNSTMAAYTTPLFSSLVAHGVGTVAAAVALVLIGALWRPGASSKGVRAPLWAYLGGVSGALTVMLTSMTANSPLALTGTLALGLVGQVVLALVFDRFGVMGLRRMPTRNDLMSLGLIVAGTLLIIFSRG
ncbi:DMT family transporter [Paenirhodobacter populi]|uniref:EamA-like transporter family protein n=1 Tax=Paenirhodobacter populi TaxID=2306993 RepID=A0A443J9S7_9RHOB|nr:DMT family transporter [Sinirhodobacter populi]RWR17247.1 EamA-like transporter family protein [Sinirhodobacter populi]